MLEKVEIKDLFRIYDPKEPVKLRYDSVSAIIDGEQHCTGDIRYIGEDYWAVFSSITKGTNLGSLYKSVMNCVNLGVYNKESITYEKIVVDHYIWVKVKFNL